MGASKYETATATAARLGITRQRVLLLAKQDRIHGAVKFGRAWMIPKAWEYVRLKPGDLTDKE